MIVAPRNNRFGGIHRYPDHMEDFLRTRFSGADIAKKPEKPVLLQNLCLSAAIELEKMRTGKDVNRTLLTDALRLLQSCGFHAYGSFTRGDPREQLEYIAPFFRDFFEQDQYTTLETVWKLCNDEYENFLAIHDLTGGDIVRAHVFFLKLNKEGYLALMRDPVRRQYLADMANA